MLEVVQNLIKKYRIHYSTGLMSDRYSLGRRAGFQKKARKLNIRLEYSSSLLLLAKSLEDRCKHLLFLHYWGCQP